NLRGVPPPMVFAPDTQHPNQGPGSTLMIHSSLPAAAVIAAVRQHLRQAHPAMIPVFGDFREDIRARLVRERILAMLAGFFGILAGALTVIGLYGMLSYAVSKRQPEIGVRIALGAQRRTIVGMIGAEAAGIFTV